MPSGMAGPILNVGGFVMPALVIANVHRNDLPPQWLARLEAEAEHYRVTLEPMKCQAPERVGMSLAMAMRGMEDEEGPEYTVADIREPMKR